MNVPTPVQDIIIENLVGTGGVRTASMVCKRWCLHARSVYAISKWGNLALVENYDSWAELIKDGNARNKPKKLGQDVLLMNELWRFEQFSDVFSVAELTTSDQLSWNFIITSIFEEINPYAQNPSAEPIPPEQTSQYLAKLQHLLEFDMALGRQIGEHEEALKAYKDFFAFVHSDYSMNDVSLMEIKGKIHHTDYEFGIVAVCEKTKKIGVIVLGDSVQLTRT